MLRIVSDGLWREVKGLARARQRTLAAIAYVSTDHLQFGLGDTLVCDASDSAISSGQTSARVLRAAFRRGAEVFSSNGLHAKAVVVGKTVVIGSANMSESSASTLDEAAVFTDDLRAVAGVRPLVHQLAAAGQRVDDAFLARIAKIKVVKAQGGSRRRRSARRDGPRAWLINVRPIDDDEHAHETSFVEAERAKASERTKFEDSHPGYIRWSGQSRFQRLVRPGDLIVEIWAPSSGSRGVKVFAPEPVLRRVSKGSVAHVWQEEHADRDEAALSFTQFKALWQRAGGGRPPSRNSVREVRLDFLEALREAWPA